MHASSISARCLMVLFLVTWSTVYAVPILTQAITLFGEVSNLVVSTLHQVVEFHIHCRFCITNLSEDLAFLIVTQQVTKIVLFALTDGHGMLLYMVVVSNFRLNLLIISFSLSASIFCDGIIILLQQTYKS